MGTETEKEILTQIEKWVMIVVAFVGDFLMMAAIVKWNDYLVTHFGFVGAVCFTISVGIVVILTVLYGSLAIARHGLTCLIRPLLFWAGVGLLVVFPASGLVGGVARSQFINLGLVAALFAGIWIEMVLNWRGYASAWM
jgi:hypothetical protein